MEMEYANLAALLALPALDLFQPTVLLVSLTALSKQTAVSATLGSPSMPVTTVFQLLVIQLARLVQDLPSSSVPLATTTPSLAPTLIANAVLLTTEMLLSLASAATTPATPACRPPILPATPARTTPGETWVESVSASSDSFETPEVSADQLCAIIPALLVLELDPTIVCLAKLTEYLL